MLSSADESTVCKGSNVGCAVAEANGVTALCDKCV